MNRHLYRLVFNRALGVLQAVAEIARARRGAGHGGTGCARVVGPLPLAAALALALSHLLPAQATEPGIAGDRSAPGEHRPTVLAAPSGAPAINITTPSAAGVSRNQYSRFDVDQRGAVLNNSRNRVRSEVGGWLPGNPWLAGGTARVILNEVNASAPSGLHGMVEVAGDRAQVVVANPAGIQADGVGFINANGVVLATGRPQFGGDGSLSAYRVGGGTIEVAGQGMNALGSGYTQLIARAVALNAALHGERIAMVLGTGMATADGEPGKSPAADDTAAEFALDVGALGGMYANKIHLLGNAHGVGMRNAGVIGAQAGEVVVTLDGRIENTGTVQASGDVRMAAATLHNQGTILAGGDQSEARVALAVAGGLHNAGTVQANGNVQLTGATLHNSGLVNAGSARATGTAALEASGLIDNRGNLQASSSVRLSTGTLRNAGVIAAGEEATLRTPGELDNRDGRIEAPRLDLDAGSLRNRGGRIAQNSPRTLALAAGQLPNRDGGRIGTAPPPTPSAEDAAPSSSVATVPSPPTADVGTTQPPAATPETTTTTAPGQPLPAGRLHVASLLDNDGGTIEALRFGLALAGERLDNSGGHLALDTLQLAGGELRNAGGSLHVVGDTHLDLSRIDNNDGELMFAALLSLRAGEFLNRGGRFHHAGQGDTQLRVDSLLDNDRGRLASHAASLEISAGQLANRDGDIVHAGNGALSLAARELLGQGGRVGSNGAVGLRAEFVDHRAAQLGGKGLDVQAATFDNRGGLVSSAEDLALKATSLRNTGGGLQSGGSARLQLAEDLDNRAGLVATAGLLDIEAGRIDNRDTHRPDAARGLQAGTLQVRGGQLDNGGGLIVVAASPTREAREAGERAASSTGAHFSLTGEVDNAGGVISAGHRLALAADALRNAGGLLHSGSAQDLSLRALTGAGRLESRGDAHIHVRGGLDHTGTMAANGQLTLVTDGQLTQRGLLNGGAVAIQAQRIDNTASGEIGSQGLTRLKAGEWIRNRGLIDGAASQLDAAEVDNLGSGRVYGDHVAISATTLRNYDETIDGRSQAGTIAARQRLDLGVATLHNRGQALIHSGGSAGVGGTLDDERTATGSAGRIENIGATIDIAGDLDLQARMLHNERPDVRIESQVGHDAEVRLEQPAWRRNGENGTRDIRGTSNYQAWEVYYLDPADILEDAPYYTPDGQRIGRAVVRLTPRTSAFFFERGGLHAALGARDRLPSAEGTVTIYYLARQDGQDNPDQVAPGERDPFAHLATFGPKPGEQSPAFRYLDEAPAWSDAYGTCRSGCVQLSAQYRYDPDRDLINPKGAGNNKLSGNERYRIARRQVTEDVLASAGPEALLQSGGDMHLSVGSLANLHGRVLAGGVQKIDGLDGRLPQIDNKAATLYRTWRFDVTHHRYDGSSAPGEAHPVSEVIGSVGAMMGGGRRLQIDGAGLRNLDAGRDAPNLRDDLGTSNLSRPGPGGTLAGGSADQVGAGSVEGRLPTASLFRPAGAGSPWLVQTDPRFSGPRDWLSSEHQLLALGYNPADLHKRLGDGFYEQGLVRDQISQLTGRRFLDGHASDEEQFRALLEHGATFARQFNLRPGLALTDAQMAALTSDIVWLVEQTVTLPDGSTTTALVPRVYMRLRPGDIKPSGAVLAADVVKADLVGDLRNNGTIHGRQLVDLKARDLGNVGGGITGGLVNLDATRDLNNLGGAIRAEHGLVAVAGNDINQVSATRSEGRHEGGNGYSITTLERLATMTVTGPNATLLLKAGGDYHSQAGQVRNEGEGGQTAILAGGSIKLDTVRVGSSEQACTGKDFSREAHSAEVGSLVQGNGDVVLQAGKDIVSTASTVNSTDGTLHAQADGDVRITHGTATDEYESATSTKKKSLFGSKQADTYSHVAQATAQGSSWGGNKVVVQGENVTVQGSTLVSDEGTMLMAKDKVSIVAAQNTLETESRRQVKKSGVFSDGGVGFSIGSQKLATTGQVTEVGHTGSVVGSVTGKTTIFADKHYQQTGSDVLGGDGVAISGATVAIENVEGSMAFRETQKTSSGGLHISIKGGAADQAAAAYQGARAAGQAQDGRLKALYALKSANELSKVTPGAIGDQVGNARDVVNGEGKANGNGMSLRIGIGGSSSSSTTQGRTTTSQASHVYSAKGDVSVVAREDNLLVAGSHVDGVNTTLAAADDLVLLSGKQARELREQDKASSGEIGITLGSEAGFGIYVSAAMAKGKGSGNGVSHDETTIGSDRGTTTFISGGDTIGIGAQIIGKRVVGQVGGDLFLRSEQDTNDYHRKDVAAGIDAAIGTGGGSASGYVAASKVDSTYKSVIEQTGVQAGVGGYHISVAGKTTLDGAAIASTAGPSNNYFRTGSLEWKDIVNEAKFKATQASVSGGGGSSGGGGNGSFQQKSDSATSVTHAGIADGTLIVHDGSGEGIHRGVTQLQQDGLKEIFDARKVSEQLQIQQVAGELGFQAAGTVAERYGWAEGSKEKVALHTAVGAAVAALGGGNVLGGAAGAGLNQSLVPVIRKAIEASGITETQDPVKFNALMQAASLAVGSVGGASGASSAWAGDVYNRQLHPIEKKVISEEIAERYARDHDVTVEQAQRTLEAQLLRMVDANAAVQGGWDQEATNYLKGYAHRVGTYSIGNDQWGNSVPLFGASAGYQRQDSTIFSAHPQTSVPPPKLGLGAAAGYFEGVATGISGTVSDTINAIAHPLDTAGKVWDSVSALFTDPVGTGQAMQESVRPMADAAQQGNLKPAGEQIGQQAVGTAIGLAAGLTGKWVSGKWIPGDSVVDAGIRWGKGVQGQGMPWEDYLAKQLPAGSRLPANFPTFDFYDLGSKTAISAKTLDTTTPSKIANPKQVFSSLKGNIDTAANFGSAKKGVISLERNDIISYQLRVAVPEKTTFEQWKQIEKAIEYGRQRGVAVRITKVR